MGFSPLNNRNRRKSKDIFEESCDLIPGGVNSPVRAFKTVGGVPLIAEYGVGPTLYDVDGNGYVDYVMSWGPLILGHAPKVVIDAINAKATKGTSFGMPTKDELNLASIVRERMPWIEKLRLVSSGTEACMTAVRIARGVTGRDIIIKFDGGYHGHSDQFLVKAGSGMATGGMPASAGVPADVTRTTISLPYNDAEAIDDCFSKHGKRIAAVIVEPVAANMGVIPPVEGFLETLRKKTKQYSNILIFDEVITGFRVAPGGGAELYNIRPDLVCLGKILGGGLPIGGVGGRAELMDNLAPLGSVYQAGTLSGNPLSTRAGIATLNQLANLNIYKHLRQYAEDLTGRIGESFSRHGLPMMINRVESLFSLFFSDHEVVDFESAQLADMSLYSKLFNGLLNRGIFIPPSGFEAWFVSHAHKREQSDITVKAIDEFLTAIQL